MEGMSVDELLELARSRLNRLTASRAERATARGAVIIDIRCACQRQRDGLVPGAIGIERNVLEWRADPRSPWRDPLLVQCRGPLILMCAQGYQSSLAAASLHDLGIAHATDLIDGFEGWREAGLPVRTWAGGDRPGNE
jgi:rhodanese-related sulfurtransferase